VLLVDPIAMRLVRMVAGLRWVTPNRLTVTAFTVGLTAAACFTQGTRPWLAAGAALYYLSFVIDCMDGKLARLLGNGSIFGAWLDFIFDRLLVLACTAALMGGQYVKTGRVEYLVLGGAVIFMNLFRYVNGGKMEKGRKDMREQLEMLQPGPAWPEPGASPTADSPNEGSFRELANATRARLRGLLRLREFLLRHRIRFALVSNIEYQMAVFIIGPALGLVLPTTIVATAMVALFEVAMVFQFWLHTRAFHLKVTSLAPLSGTRPFPAQAAPAEPPAMPGPGAEAGLTAGARPA